MKTLQLLGVGLALAAGIAHADRPDGPVGPVKPVVVTNEADKPVPVTIQGDARQPLPVVDQSRPNREPFRRFVRSPWADGGVTSSIECFNVPEDRWLEIQFVSASVIETAVRVSSRIYTETSAGLGGFRHNLGLENIGPTNVPDTSIFNLAQKTVVRSSPGSEVCVAFLRSAAGRDNPNASILLEGVLTTEFGID